MKSRINQRVKTRLSLPALLWACAGLLWTGCGQEVRDPSTIVLENSQLRRVLKKDHDVWRTTSFSRANGSHEVTVESDEFRILLMDGTRLSLQDYRVQGDPMLRTENGRSLIEIVYVPREEPHRQAPQSILMEYSLAEEPYLSKTLTLTMEEGEAVDRLEVERFKTGLVCDRGGIGQPIFLADSWFVGLEYPGSFTEHSGGLVTLAHYPGLAKQDEERKWVIRSKTAVAGVPGEGDPLELAFYDYLETIRQPAPKHMLANTWVVDRGWKSGKGFGVEEFVDYYDLFEKNLAAYGVRLDSLQPDLKGFEPESVSMPDKRFFPQGYRPLSEQLESRGSSLSLWLALNGTGIEAMESLAAQGFERTNGPFQDFWGHFCVAAPRFNTAIRNTLKKTIEDGNISYFKHDFVQMICSREGHGHLPTVRHGFEANLDATLELLDYERRLKPDILSAPTSYVWLSPWWLMHANYIYMGVGNFGNVATRPQVSYREWEMAFRGRVIYPYGEDLPQQFTSGVPILFTVPGYTVMLMELEPGQVSPIVPAEAEGLIEGRGSVTLKERDWSDFYENPHMALTATVSLQVPEEAMARCDLFFIIQSNGALPEFPKLTLNGKPARVRLAEGHADTPAEAQPPRDTDAINWSIRALDLTEFRGREVQLVAVSSKNPVPFQVEAWVAADRPVRTTPVPEGNLPPTFWQNFRRQTIRLLSYSLSRVPIYH